MAPRLHPVMLDAEQRARLEEAAGQACSPAWAITRTRILLKAGCASRGPGWADTAIA